MAGKVQNKDNRVIAYRKGDLFTHLRDNLAIIHVVNNKARMGSGFVVPLMECFPGVKQAYQSWFDLCEKPPNLPFTTSGHAQLGEIQIINYTVPFDIQIINMVAQDGVFGHYNKRPIKYDALLACLEQVELLVDYDRNIVAPRFGAGLAGGNWNIIAAIINSVFDTGDGDPRDLTVYEL
jgi:O-acetyl-ADP-ribose deacetylase (regulator of RNase III)